MIRATTNVSEIARRLLDKASALARARAVMIARRRDAGRWRKAGLLWPLFGQD